jgi:hypothetical protein
MNVENSHLAYQIQHKWETAKDNRHPFHILEMTHTKTQVISQQFIMGLISFICSEVYADAQWGATI